MYNSHLARELPFHFIIVFMINFIEFYCCDLLPVLLCIESRCSMDVMTECQYTSVIVCMDLRRPGMSEYPCSGGGGSENTGQSHLWKMIAN